jgi:perosamine synthetase
MYTIILAGAAPCSRDELMARLEADGIETRPVFYPMHVLPPYREDTGRFPVADHLAAHGINLPTHGLLTENDVDFVVARLRAHLTASVALGRGA